MSALIIYFILTHDHRWEFFAIEETESRTYCELLASETKELFADRPGNIRILCADNEEKEI